MTISFDGIPTTRRLPGSFTEIDGSQAVRGVQPDEQKALIIAQKLSTGTAAVEVPVQVRSEAEGKAFGGAGSLLAMMCKSFLKNNPWTELWVIPLDDVSAGTKAAGKFAITGQATEAGTFSAYIGGVRVAVAVASGDAAAAVATALRAAIDDNEDLPVDDGGSSGDVEVTFKHKGSVGNSLDLRLNMNTGEKLPAGLACTITAMTGGGTDPDVQDAIDAFGNVQWDHIMHPYSDSTNSGALDDELETRWGPLSQIDGHAWGAVDKSYSDLATFGNALNSKQLTFVGLHKCPSPPWAIAAAVGGAAAFYSPTDPARPLHNITLVDILPPAKEDRFTDAERELLLHDGIATLKITAGGDVVLERLITTYKTNANGVDDPAFLDVEPKFTLSRLRKEHNANVLRKFPRHKLADDGTRFGAGQAIITPKGYKAFVLGEFRDWEEQGWVEGFAQFKEDLIAERPSTDRCRLDALLKPDVVNQLRILGTKMSFYL